jgi:hypothetical protein
LERVKKKKETKDPQRFTLKSTLLYANETENKRPKLKLFLRWKKHLNSRHDQY